MLKKKKESKRIWKGPLLPTIQQGEELEKKSSEKEKWKQTLSIATWLLPSTEIENGEKTIKKDKWNNLALREMCFEDYSSEFGSFYGEESNNKKPKIAEPKKELLAQVSSLQEVKKAAKENILIRKEDIARDLKLSEKTKALISEKQEKQRGGEDQDTS